MRYAVYRCLYGEDYIQESIKSIEKYVDKIFIFWTNKAWGDTTQVKYNKETVIFPKKFDSIIDKIKKLNNNKIIFIEAYTKAPHNQLTQFINTLLLPDYEKPDTLIIPEVDHVFRKDQIEDAINQFESSTYTVATTNQIELWKTHEYHIPKRGRKGTMFWNMKNISEFPVTDTAGDSINGQPTLNAFNHNFGFAVSEKVMYWKHLTALAFSSVVRDSAPNPGWLDNIWKTWDLETNNKNLEISIGAESRIPYAMKYNTSELPEVIKEKYKL